VPSDSIRSLSSRHQEILRRAFIEKSVKTRELAHEYGVHEMTIRRDLEQLCESGHLERIHGGARLTDRVSEELSHQLRVTRNGPAKVAIAQEALSLIENGETIALDASTSSLELAKLLFMREIKVITTSLEIAKTLANLGTPFILAGGEFNPRAQSFIGSLVESTLSRLHPDKVFFSAKGLTARIGFTDSNIFEADVKEHLIRSASTKVALLDSSKFGKKALATIARLEDVDILVTNDEPTPDALSEIELAGVRLVIAGQAACGQSPLAQIP
jgi:DeoR family transcriptional regulator, fructose operon transcriptional repressor